MENIRCRAPKTKAQLRNRSYALIVLFEIIVLGKEYPALEHLIEKFDNNKWSHTYWHYYIDFEQSKIMDIICRPLPIAVAGEIKNYSFDRKNKEFTLQYTGTASTKAPTLIYLPSEPKKVYSTKAYKYADGILKVNAGKGECIVKVEL